MKTAVDYSEAFFKVYQQANFERTGEMLLRADDFSKWLVSGVKKFIQSAIDEERERIRPKTPEEAKSFVESEIRKNEILRSALESKIEQEKNQARIQEREHCIESLKQLRNTADRARTESLDRKEMGADWLSGFWTGANEAVTRIEKRRHTRPEEINQQSEGNTQ